MATPTEQELAELFLDIEELRPQTDETTRAYTAFRDYCALGGGRSLRRLRALYLERQAAIKTAAEQRARSGGASASAVAPMPHPPSVHDRTLEGWSSTYKWGERVRVYEAAVGRLARAMEAKSLAEMRERHTNFALAMLNLAASRMQMLQGDELSISELRLYIAEAIRLERQARGADVLGLLTDEESAAGTTVRTARYKIVEVVKDYGDQTPAEE